jgi:hypothetical protein
MKNAFMKLFCIFGVLFFGLVLFGDDRTCAANEDGRKWSFDFNEHSPAEVLQQMGAICGVDCFIHQKQDEGFSELYQGLTLEQMLAKLLQQENSALVWHYEADRLRGVDVWIFNGKSKIDSPEITVGKQQATPGKKGRVDGKAQFLQRLEQPPMMDKPSGLEPPPMPPIFE